MSKKDQFDEMTAAGGLGPQAHVPSDEDLARAESFVRGLPFVQEEIQIYLARRLVPEAKMLSELLRSDPVAAAALVAESIQEEIVREYVRLKVRENVRKKKGGGGYVLYSPNKGKKHPPKAVGTFPTKKAAKEAEMNRFPPQDPKKLARLRKTVKSLKNDRNNDGKPDQKQKQPKPAKMKESLFREEQTGSRWDERISKLPPDVLQNDKKLAALHGDVQKKSAAALGQAVQAAKNAFKPLKMKVEASKPQTKDGKMFVELKLDAETTSVGPIHIYIEDGHVRLEVGEQARSSFTRLEPAQTKAIRSELATLQEEKLDQIESVRAAINKRDAYLDGVEARVDNAMAKMTKLELLAMKNLLVAKYKGGR
jgi:hypothetical protein